MFVGVGGQEYGPRIYDESEGFAGYLTTGTTPAVASGRVAYTLGLQGPALTIDTACSSSLVAVHLAVRSLRSGECEVAVAGGATVVCSPSIYIGLGRQGALSSDGRSRPFAAGAEGFGVAEGAGMLVLARLSQARSLGYPVLALIRGSALGQDGASDVLTAPSGPAQQRVIRQALVDADLAAGDIDVVEAHGTGTKVGDPIEATALQATYGEAHSAARPLLVGSVKSNIGHAQYAAGVAGVIKAVQSIRHGLVPATSSGFAYTTGGLVVQKDRGFWQRTSVARPARPTPAGWGVGVRHQRHKCPRNTRTGAAGIGDRGAGSQPPCR